jgi:hypothetical protein
MKSYQPGGRFDSAYEANDILTGIAVDSQRTVGTLAKWWVFDPVNTVEDPVYDVGASTGGRMWHGPYDLPVIRALIQQGEIDASERGFYSGDMLHLTLDAQQVETIMPNVVGNPDLEGRGRIIWLGEVWRPIKIQQRGIVANTFTLLSVDCIQVMAEEMVNDPQFQQYAGLYDQAQTNPVVLDEHYN